MPFKSEKQRRYMHANLPDIAKRWERDYAGGGIAELNQELNSLPAYYLPKNQGGRIGFGSGTNGITLGSDKYNITFEPGASGSLSSRDLGEGYKIDQKNISYGVDTTANLGPIGIGIDYKKYLDKYDVTKDDVTVEKDTERDRQIAYMLDLDLDTLYAKIDSDRDFKNFYLTLRYEFNQGGVVPAHEAGIYGLEDGGQLVQPGPGRPGYNGQGDYTPDRSTPSNGGGNGRPTMRDVAGPIITPKTPTTVDRNGKAPPGEKGGPGYISPEDLKTLGVTTGDVDGKITIDELYESNKPKNTRAQLLLGKIKAKYPNFFQLDTAKKINQIKNMSWKDALNLEKQMSKSLFGTGYTGADKVKTGKYFGEGIKSLFLDPSKWSSKIGGATPLAKKLAVLAGEKVLPAVMGGSNILSAPLAYVQGASMLQNFLESQGMPKGALGDDILGKGVMAGGADVLSVPTDIEESSQNVPEIPTSIIESPWEGQEGGRIGLQGGQLVKPGPGRQGYQGPQDWGQEARGTGAYSGASEPSWEGGGYDQPSAPETKTVERDDGPYRNVHFDTPEILEEQRKLDLQQMVRDQEEERGTETWEKAQQWNKPTVTIGGMAVNLLTFTLTGGIDNPLTRQAASKLVKWGADKIGFEDTINTFVGENFGTIDEMKARIEEKVARQDLIQSLPRGHPERIQLEGLTKETITPERDNGRIQETSIKIEDIEGYNEQKRASAEANKILEKVDRSKQDAYYAAFRQKYLMGPTAIAAQGGRVPAGYNTGGLSNLFKLKNV